MAEVCAITDTQLTNILAAVCVACVVGAAICLVVCIRQYVAAKKERR